MHLSYYAQLLVLMTVYEESFRDEIAIGPFMETGFILFHLFISISHCEVYSKQRTRYVFSYDPLQRRLDAMSRRLRIGEYGQRWILYWIDSFNPGLPICLAVACNSIADSFRKRSCYGIQCVFVRYVIRQMLKYIKVRRPSYVRLEQR